MRVNRLAAGAIGGLIVMAAVGCGAHKQADSPYVGGRARVVEVYPELGQVLLEMEDGQRVNAFWQTEQTTARTGMATAGSALSAPTAMYQEPNVQAMVFPAKAGEYIDFAGVKMGNEFMLGRVAVVR